MTKDNKNSSYRLYLLLAIAILIPLFVIKQLYFPTENKLDKEPEYVGRESCAECHNVEQMDFMGSHHDLAMDIANDSTVLADFDNAELVRPNGQVHKAYKRDDKYYVLTDSEDGSLKEYEIKYVFGAEPLQNYLVEFPGGRLQVLGMTWNTTDQTWYYMSDSVYKDMNVNHGDWLHWTNQAQNWNSMCAFCHTTGFQKKYDVETDSYSTTWTEIDVSCEACHGPASNHLAWADMPEYAKAEIPNYGLVTKTSGLTNEELVAQCAQCHSRRGTFSDLDPHNMATYDFMQMALPMQPDWYVDGQIKSEDYVVASFMQSKMFQRGVACNDCHNVHSGERVLEGNALCLQCHNADDYDTYEHHRHQPVGGSGEAVTSMYGDTYEVGSGAECINCHMPAQYYMGVDLRNDHSFRVPRPDLSDELGTPNACIQCHGDETNQWAAQHIEDWHGKPYKHHWGEDVYAAIHNKAGADSALLKIIDSAPEVYPNVVRGVALSTIDQVEHADVLYRYLTDENDMLRSAAANALSIYSEEDAQHLFPLLRDQRRSIRIGTVLKLASYPRDLFPEKYKQDYADALEDFGEMQTYSADFPMGKFNLGNYYIMKSNIAKTPEDSIAFDAKAEEFFIKAYEQDTATNEFALQLAYRYNQKGDYEKSIFYFQRYLDIVPDDAQIRYDYGLMLSSWAGEQINQLGVQDISLMQKKKYYDRGLKQLETAIELDPSNPAFNPNNIAQIYLYYGETSKAQQVLENMLKLRPDNPNDYFSLLQFYAQTSNKPKADALAQEIVAKFPDDERSQQLIGWSL